MTMPHLMNCAHSDDSWCLDCVKAEWERTNAEIERLESTVNRLPKTKDGVRVIPMIDRVWHPDFTGCGTLKECGRVYWACYMRFVSDCYSTQKAAEQAR